MRPGTFRSALWPTECHCRGCGWVGAQGRAWPTLMVCVYSRTVVCMCQGGKTPQPGLWSHESQCWGGPSAGLQDVPDVTIPGQTLRLLSETLSGAEVVVSLSHRRRLSPGQAGAPRGGRSPLQHSRPSTRRPAQIVNAAPITWPHSAVSAPAAQTSAVGAEKGTGHSAHVRPRRKPLSAAWRPVAPVPGALFPPHSRHGR